MMSPSRSECKRLHRFLHRPHNPVETVRMAAWSCAIVFSVCFLIYQLHVILPLLNITPSPAFLVLWNIGVCLISFFVTIFITITFGFRVPQLLGGRYAERFGYWSVGVSRVLIIPFLPLLWLTRALSGLIARLFGADSNKIEEAVTEEEIRMLVDVGNEIGFIEESQKEMINNIFEFDDTTAGEVMTHRTEVVAVERNTKISGVVYLAINEGFSRLPVYEKDLDNILGLIYVKDLLCLVGCNSSEEFKIDDFIRPTLYVPEATKCRALLAEFKKNKAHLAVVVDEYGGTAGIVSMEDIIESIVGDIEDEYDEQEESVQKLDEETYLISGTVELSEVGELLRLTFEKDEDFDTLGGFIVHILGRIPKDDETPAIEYGGYRFAVLAMEERRVDKVKVQKIEASQMEEETLFSKEEKY